MGRYQVSVESLGGAYNGGLDWNNNADARNYQNRYSTALARAQGLIDCMAVR